MINNYDVNTLYVESNNEIVIHLYKNFGFEITESFIGEDNVKFYVMVRSNEKILNK